MEGGKRRRNEDIGGQEVEDGKWKSIAVDGGEARMRKMVRGEGD
jgi:hypothetical protein